MARVYISSTYSDLEDCREAVYRALRTMGHDVIAMEDYVASDQRPLDKCLADVARCDIYVGIFAWRYGYVPAKDNPEQKSITELELRHAADKGIPRLIFLLHEEAPWPRSLMEQGAGGDKIKALRDELSTEYTISFFKSCDQLAALAAAAVTNRLNSPPGDSPAVAAPPPPGPDKVSISRLPVTGPDLFGRDEHLRRLDEAWADPGTHILSLVAWGGVGKSALVNHWLGRMARDDYRGAQTIYGWSFFSQGASDRAASADQFIEAALVFFGDPDPNKGSPWDKGERLARLVGAHRSLLVLDGLEPLQHPPGPDGGRLKDQALQSLLRQLAAGNEGLCLITTRVAIADLESFERSTAARVDLEHLSPEAGAQVLVAQGARGTQAELEQASVEFGGHSLALTLLGSYLSDVYGGDIKRRTEVTGLEEDERHGGHARRVMTSYERWFGEGHELAVLRMLGLFNRPADKDSVAALRAAPAIAGLTDSLQGLSETGWQRTLSRLRRARLLAAPSPDAPGTLDTHPLVREHFARQLKETRPDAWREGNDRLYEHLKSAAPELPETIEEMSPLYAAVAHGCEAGRYSDALMEVYRARILRGRRFYSREVLGAISADLAAVSAFLDRAQGKAVAELNERQQAFVLGDAGALLGVAGRLEEAIPLHEASLQVTISQGNWIGACINARTIGRQHLQLGDIPRALARLEYSLELSNRARVSRQKILCTAALAHAQHCAGRWAEAEAGFRKAEGFQKQSEAGYAVLPAGTTQNYCELLLDKGLYEEVKSRAQPLLERMTRIRSVAHIALSHLFLGLAYLGESRKGVPGALAQSAVHLGKAVNGIRQSGRLNKLPHALTARAAMFRAAGDFDQARLDLNEALGMAESSRMALFQADCHLEYARLHLATGDTEKARANWLAAKKIIEQKQYGRRSGDVEEIGEALGES